MKIFISVSISLYFSSFLRGGPCKLPNEINRNISDVTELQIGNLLGPNETHMFIRVFFYRCSWWLMFPPPQCHITWQGGPIPLLRACQTWCPRLPTSSHWESPILFQPIWVLRLASLTSRVFLLTQTRRKCFWTLSRLHSQHFLTASPE